MNAAPATRHTWAGTAYLGVRAHGILAHLAH